MTSYVSTNRLRLRMAGGICGRGGTAAGAGGVYNIATGLGTPTMFGCCIETHTVTTTGQWTRQVRGRLTGATLVARWMTGNAGSAGGATTCAIRWFAAE